MSTSGGLLGPSPGAYVPVPTTQITIEDVAPTFNPIYVQSSAGGTSSKSAVLVDYIFDSSGAGDISNVEAFQVRVSYMATDVVTPSNLGANALVGNINYGYDYLTNTYASAIGSSLAFSANHVIYQSGSAGNEHACYFGALRFDIGTGYATAVNAGRAWFTDFTLLGAIGVQQQLLNGVTMCINNYYNGTPSASPAAGMWIVTSAGAGGGMDSVHLAATTYPVDVGLGITGTSTGSGVGFTTAIEIGGGSRSGWNVNSHIGTGITIYNFATAGISIATRYAGSTAPAIAIASGCGPVLIGETAAVETTTLLEVTSTALADPLVYIGGGNSGNAQSVELHTANGGCKWYIAGAANEFTTGTVAGDSGLIPTGSTQTLHLAGVSGSSVIAVGPNKLGFFNTAPATIQTVTGSKVANPALASLMTALDAYGLVIDTTT
jgi:hypothetical protein